MFTLLSILGISCVLCSLLTPLAGFLACRWGLVDRPDARRKLHGRPIPVAGGLAIFASGVVVLSAAFVTPHPLQEHLMARSSSLLGLLLASGLICGLGVLDDYHCLRGRQKLLGQIVAVGVVMVFGVRVDHVELFGWNVELGALAVPATLIYLLGAINSLNLLDGMDGMLGCVGFIITLALAGMAVLGGHWAMACVAAAMAGTLLGFLRLNLPPATIFMGDAGSMLTGLVVGVLAIQSSLKGPATVALVAPLVMLTIPFLDTAAAVVRRKLTGRSIYATDRGHLHHCLLRRGFSVAGVLALVSLCCTLTVLSALASQAWKNETFAVCSTVTVVCVLVATRLFGYAEFVLVCQQLGRLGSSLMQKPGARSPLRLEIHLQGTGNWKELMEAVTDRATTLNLQMVCLDVSAPAIHEQYHARWQRSEEETDAILWRAEVPLSIDDHVVGRLQVSGVPDGEPLWSKVAALSRLIEEFEGNSVESSPVRWRKDSFVPSRVDGPIRVPLRSSRFSGL